eukprot:COSAG04_NODE_1006_length_8814_cov_4.556053_4_plen_794_part_00
MPAGSVTISLIQKHEADEIFLAGFRTVVQLQSGGGEWVTVFQRGSNETCAATACNQSASKHAPALKGCSVSCADAAQVTLKLAATTMLRTRLEVARDTGGNLGVCVNAVATSGASRQPVAWSFYSGIDPSLSSVLLEEQAIINATKTIRECTCDTNASKRSDTIKTDDFQPSETEAVVKALVQQVEMMQNEMTAMRGEITELQSFKAQVEKDQENGKRPHRRRRAQAQACDANTFQARTDEAMDACCPSASGGHRRLQGTDCDLPDTCPSAACANVFVPYYAECETMLGRTVGVPLEQFRAFSSSCEGLQGAESMLKEAEPAMIFHVLVLDDASAQAQSMFGGVGGSAPGPALEPLQPLAQPPAPAPAGSAVGLKEFQRVCTKANLATCVPVCDVQTHGFLLSIEIEGRGTVMTCNKVDGIFSWQGQASLGGFLGADFPSFYSAVVSGAAGCYQVALSEDVDVRGDLRIEPGQAVDIRGDRELQAPPTWGNPRGAPSAFRVQQFATLSLEYLVINSGIYVESGAQALALADCALNRLRNDVIDTHDAKVAIKGTDLGERTISTSGLLSVVSSSFKSLQVNAGGSATIESSTLGLPDRGGSLSVTGGNATLLGCTLLQCGEHACGDYRISGWPISPRDPELRIVDSVLDSPTPKGIEISNGGLLLFATMNLPSLEFLTDTLMPNRRRIYRGSVQFDAVSIPSSPGFGELSGTMTNTAEPVCLDDGQEASCILDGSCSGNPACDHSCCGTTSRTVTSLDPPGFLQQLAELCSTIDWDAFPAPHEHQTIDGQDDCF